MKKKQLTALTLAALMAASLTACSGAGSASEGESKGDGTESSLQAPSSEQTGAPSESGSTSEALEDVTVILDYVAYISANQSTALFVAGVTMTLFSASAAFRSLMDIMDDIYERKSYTGLRQIVASVIFSVLLLVTIYLSLVVLLTGNWLFQLIERFFHLDPGDLPWDWQWLRFLILFALVFLFVLLVYRMAAPRGKPRPPLFTGALIASAVLVAASMIFSWFIGMSTRYSLVYGSITSVVILMIWLYLCGNILILGNVFNCVWYRHKKVRFLKKLKES